MSAKSLCCDICKAQFRGMREAQEHGEATGHASFSESTEAVLTLVCAECGKPCRTVTEQEVHTKRNPGHTTFVDKTQEAAAAVDTAAEVKSLRAEAAAEARGEAAGAPGAVTAMEVEDEPDGEMVVPEVPQALLEQLTSEFGVCVKRRHWGSSQPLAHSSLPLHPGFGEHRARQALYATGTDSIQVAVDWLGEHQDDEAYDKPLLVPKNKLKKKLTKEEARLQAEELRKAAAARRDKEEKEAEKLREKERIRMGKEIQAAKRIDEDQERRRNLAWRQREKEEEAKARERIRVKLEEDKRERRRKLGLPEELTAEEVAAEAAKAQAQAEAEAKAKADAAARASAVRPVSVAERLRAELVAVKRATADAPDRHKQAFTTLMTFCGNVARAPEEEKYRRIRVSNPAFQQRVASIDGGLRFLALVGFVPDSTGEFLEIPRAAISPAVLNAAGAELQNAMENPFFGVL